MIQQIEQKYCNSDWQGVGEGWAIRGKESRRVKETEESMGYGIKKGLHRGKKPSRGFGKGKLFLCPQRVGKSRWIALKSQS